MTALTPLQQAWCDQLQQKRIIAVIRTQSPQLAITLAGVAADAGLRLIEITWNTTEVANVIAQLRQQLPHCQVGTGTVLTSAELTQAIACGSQFCFTPHVNLALIEQATQANIPMIPGALTPTEIITAWQAGASAVKVFPIQAVGGVDYLRALQGPLGTIPLIPTGGVTLENARSFLQSGAIAVGLSGQLFPADWVERQDWPALRTRIQTLRLQLKSGD